MKFLCGQMARFARIDSQIRANRLILANRFRVPELNPFSCESHFGEPKTANRRFQAIRANAIRVVKIVFFVFVNRFARIGESETIFSGN